MSLADLAAISTAGGLWRESGERIRDQGPAWDLAQFFNGKLVAHGLVTNRSGEVTSRFRVEMVGHWQDGKGSCSSSSTSMMVDSKLAPGI